MPPTSFLEFSIQWNNYEQLFKQWNNETMKQLFPH